MPQARFRIKRHDPARDAGDADRYDEFVVEYESSLTVLEGLFAIQECQDPSLAFRIMQRMSGRIRDLNGELAKRDQTG